VAFEDSLIGSHDFDPVTAQDELLRRQMGEPLPATLETRDLNTRMLRKLGREPLPREVSPGLIGPAKTQTPSQQELDFTGFEPAPDAPQTPETLDFSGFEPDEPPKPAEKVPEHYAITRGFVSGIMKENPEGLAETLEGLSHLGPADLKDSLQGASKEVAGLAKLRPEEYAKKSGSMWDIKSVGDALTWAGETLGSGLASTVPSLAGGTAGAVVGGRVGGKTGAVVGATAGASVPSAVLNYGEVYKALKDEKVAPEDAAQYAALAVGPMTALDVASLGPIIGRLGGIKEVQSQLARGIAKRIAAEAAKGAGREGLTEGIQDVIEKATVSWASGKPFLTEETLKSALENAAGGALVGGVTGGASGIKPDNIAAGPAPSPAPGPGAPGGPLGGPGGPSGAAPGPGPQSSPEDIADFVRQAQQGNRNQQTASGPSQQQADPDPADLSDADLSAAFQQTRDLFGGASLDDILRQGGWMEGSLDHLDDRGKVVEAVKIGREKATGTGKFAPENTGPEPGQQPDTSGPQQEGLKPQPPADHRQYATLREYGYSDEDIGNMSAAQRSREVLDAEAEGIKPDEAMKKYAPPVAESVTGSAGTRDKPIVAETAEHVQAAQPVEPKSDAQAQAENYKHAHVELPALGLVGKHSISVETGAGQTRRGVDPSGKAWEVVLKHAYGRIKGTKGADGQPLDIVIGPNPQSQHVFVIDQHEPGKGFDEHKTFAGFDTPQQAIVAYAGMYNDQGAGRIGHVTAFTPEQFEAWRQGDTTKPLGPKAPSAPNTTAGVGADARALTEAGTVSPVPKGSSLPGGDGNEPASTTHETAAESGQKETVSEIIPPGRLTAEPAQDHHDQIEAVLGEDYHRVAEVDIQRAAELMAENEGMSAETAFGQAVIENAVDQGFLTEQEAEQAYGEKVKDVLDAGREGASERGETVVGEGTEPVEVSSGGAEETGVIPGSSEDSGAVEDVSAVEAADNQDREQHDAERADADAEREAGGAADEEAPNAAEVANQRHRYAVDRATDERWKELVDATIDQVHPGDIFAATRLNIELGSLTTKNARAMLEAMGEEEIPKEESIDILARSKIEQLQGGKKVAFPYKDENAQGRMWATIVGFEDGYINSKGPTKKLEKLIANPPPPLPPLPETSDNLPAGRNDLYVEIEGKRLPMASYAQASEAYVRAIEQTGATASGETGPKAPSLNITDSNGKIVAHISYNGKVWSGPAEKAFGGDATLLYNPTERGAGDKQSEPSAAKIEDTGEKIGGARKDQWAGGLSLDDYEKMTGPEQAKNLTKDKFFPRPDYQAMVADGVDPLAAALMKRIYDRLPSKPNHDRYRGYDDGSKAYIEALGKVREAFKKAKTADDVKKIDDAAGIDWSSKGIIYPIGGRMNPLAIGWKDERAAKAAVEQGFPNMAAWQRLFEVQHRTIYPSSADRAKGITEPRERWLALRKTGGRIGNEDGYVTKEEAEAVAKEAYDKLGDERKKGDEEPKRPFLEHVFRSGPDYRDGKDITAEQFQETFGFRGVEWGNYVTQKERQPLINHAYDALQDLARVLKIPPKAISLNGTLGAAFGARGRGGKAAAHYEPSYVVFNMQKMNGAGSLAHEFGHALDHYLGELGTPNAYKGAAQWASGGDAEPNISKFRAGDFRDQNRHLPPKLRTAVNRVLQGLIGVEESDALFEQRLRAEIERGREVQQGWRDALKRYRERKASGGSGAGMKKAEDQIGIWERHLKMLERDLEQGRKKWTYSNYYREAEKLSGSTGNYWKRPVELWARAFETYVFDKLAEEGFESQYLVHGTEANRFGNGFKGNPFPTGDERNALIANFDRVVRALNVTDGKKIESQPGEPEPVETVTKVFKPTPQPSFQEEAEAVAADSAKTLDQAFQAHFTGGGSFDNILSARRFAKERGFAEDAKSVEEALEFGIVKAARSIASNETMRPDEVYSTLVSLYGKQPKLGTRTSTSVRDQAYSTPVPLAYLAGRLAGFDGTEKIVYEPTAGNGALLLATNPKGVYANELNPERAKNLREQGFFVGTNDASAPWSGKPRSYDVVIANPPFGPVKEGGLTKEFNLQAETGVPYRTSQIDHAIAIRALEAMKDDGRAVLIVGGVHKMAKTEQGRADAYNAKDKREFYKALFDNYNVADHFTVAGELYERQGAGWPVDVIVIHGRGKSARPLPAVQPPRIYDSWEALGGKLDGQQTEGNVRPAAIEAGVTAPETGAGLEGGRGADSANAGVGQPGPVEPVGVRGQRGERIGVTGEAGSGKPDESGRSGQDQQPARSGEQPATVDDFDAAFDAALDAAFGPAATTGDATQTAGERPGSRRPKPTSAGPKPTSEVAKDTAKAAVDAADEAFSALYQLFGGGKTVAMGVVFDEDTYKKAKPHFEAAADKFSEFKNNLGELLNRMVAHLRDVMQFTREAMERIKPYLKRFIEDMRAAEEQEPVRKEAIKAAPTETENQVVYKPRSKVTGLDTLAPVNMAKPMADSLDALETRVGPLDAFVAKELGYKPEELGTYFGAEQVDALALAIDNIKAGKGFIIGDQTGIGKGRVNAAIIRWAIVNERMPVFVTEKPNLYRDMFRDLTDIGITDVLKGEKPRILATNATLNLPLEDGNGVVLKTGDAKSHNKHLGDVVRDMRKSYDMVFTTYNQTQTQKGEETARRDFLRTLSNQQGGIVIILDEAHNAGGQKETRGGKKDEGGNKAPAGRSGFLRDMIRNANGVFYSSATYAKRPDVMDLYSATDMAMAVENIGDLAEAIAKGGIPMQQAVASMLAKAGQYMRRERSFAGINYNSPSVPVDRENYDRISYALAAIQDLSKYVKKVADRISQQIRSEAGAVAGDMAVGDAGASSSNFTAVMHNVINQMLLAMKSRWAIDHAIKVIKAGEKPVLTVANTMEAFLEDYADQLDLKPGDEMRGDFSHVLKKYADRSRTILIKKAHRAKGEKPERHYLTDEELGSIGKQLYDRAISIIESADLSGLPLSPIDYIKGELKKAGYDTGEITGRTLAVDYTGKVPVFSSRPGGEKTAKGRTETLKRFNSRPKRGGYHAMIINQAGSTGLSAHASSTFDDQSKRRMLIVQPEGNIDTHMQILGRINRTGQVVLPEYDQLVADIPAEKRPAANLAKKMASLNANTTASRTSAVTSKDTPDFINQYGDEIAANWASDNPERNFRLGMPIKISEEGIPDKVDAMRKLTGRIPLLPLKEQEALYEELESEYKALIDQLDAAGENALEAKSLDLKGRLVEYMEVQGRKNDSGSPFAAPVIMQKVSIARLGKPFKPVDIINKLREAIDPDEAAAAKFGDGTPIENLATKLKAFSDPYSADGKKASDIWRAQRQGTIDRFTSYSREILDDIETAEKQATEKEKLDKAKTRWISAHDLVPIGRRVVIKTATSNLTGIVLDVKQTGSPKNPMAMGSWKATFAIADATRQMVIPFSRIFPTGGANADSNTDVEIEPMTDWYETYQQTLDKFLHMQSEAREERWIAGGNILAGYDWLDKKGAIVNYTSYRGTVHQGILTARGFDPAKQAIDHGAIERNPDKIREFLESGERLHAKDGNISIQKGARYSNDWIVVAQKAKQKGGKYYLDKALTDLIGDFSSKGGNMVAYLYPTNFNQGVRRLMELGAEFRLPTKRPETVKVTPRKDDEPPAGDEPLLATVRQQYNLEDHLTPEQIARAKELVIQAVRRMLGDRANVGFLDRPAVLTDAMKKAWGIGNEAVAQFKPWSKLIEFAMDSNLETNVPHEVYHFVEYLLQTDAERALMQRETPRIREAIKPYASAKYSISDEQIDRLSDEEVRAIGMEAFDQGQLRGAHLGVRRWYQKLWDALRWLAAKLRGMDVKWPEFSTAGDIYQKVRTGGYREAPGTTPRPEAEQQEAAAIRPGGARPGPQPQNETISEQLMDRGHDMLSGLSNRLGIGRFNTTEARTLLQDKFIRVRRAEESVGGVPSPLSAYQAESLYYGRTGERLERLEKDHFEPLIEAMHDADISPGEMNNYLYARHAPARNAYIDSINPNLNGEGSGWSDAEAARVLAGIPAAKLPDYQRIERMIRQIIDDTRSTMVAYGLISQETADAWEAMYPDGTYVPLRGFAEGSEDENLVGGRPRGFDIRGKESKPAFGRKSEADGPLHYIIQQAQSAIVRGEKNRVGNTFLRFVRANPDPDRWQVNAPTLKRRIDARTGLVTYYADFNYHMEPDAFVTKVGGKPMVIRLYGKDGMNIARALKSIGASTMHPVLQVIHTLTTLQSRLSTQWNPNFTLPNFARDFGEAFINLQEQDQQRFVTQFMKHVAPALAGSFRALNGAPAGNPYVDAFREFDRVGGRVRFFGLDDPDQIKKKVNSMMRRLEGGGFQSVMNLARTVGEAFEVVNGSVESATRLAAYMAARDVGMSAPDAAMLARNITVDFNKRGEWGPAINALFMFGGASIQGTARLGRALMHKRVRRAAYALVAMGAVGALYNMMAGGDDDDGTPYYSKIKPWIRDKNLIIMWPKGYGHDGKYVKIPLPFGFAPFHVMGDRAAGVALGKDKIGQAAHSVLASVADAFNPVGEESSLWSMLVPSLLRPGLHIATNLNWTGNPLYPDHDYNKTKPDAEKYYRSNSDFSKWAARTMNEATGGSKYKSGWIDVHPGSIDHVLETVTGGLGKFVMDVVKTGGAIIKGEPFDDTRAPIIRRFIGSAKDPVSDAQAYYEAREEARKGGGENLRAARKDLQSGKNREQAESFIRENPNAARANEIFKAADERMKPLRARKERIEESTELSREQKRKEIDAVVEQMRQVQNAARKRYMELKGARP